METTRSMRQMLLGYAQIDDIWWNGKGWGRNKSRFTV